MIIGGAVAVLFLCGVGVMCLRREGPSPYDEEGKARLPILMPRADAEKYLRRIGYPQFRNGGGGRLLIAEDAYCATEQECRTRKPKLVFDYTGGDEQPRCITVSHGYDLDARNVLSKLAGVDEDVKPDKARQSVSSPVGKLTLIMPSKSQLSVGPGC